MNRPLRWKGILGACALATGTACGAVLVGPFAASARADAGTDVEKFCHDSLGEASAAKRSIEGMVTALQEAGKRVDESAPADREATIERAQAGIHGLRAAAGQQLRTSSDNIEDNEPPGLAYDWRELADQLVAAQRDLSDTILYKELPDLKPAVDNLNETSVAFFSRCDAQYPNYPHASSDE
ncbi:MAG: hypothetical protein ACRC20_17035 [Segniliparus sp.]|uniref:hypothetical protein n=1 Tax=Segniliparus sp. TaxID=2804064 RepID=UPI003F3478CA